MGQHNGCGDRSISILVGQQLRTWVLHPLPRIVASHGFGGADPSCEEALYRGCLQLAVTLVHTQMKKAAHMGGIWVGTWMKSIYKNFIRRGKISLANFGTMFIAN